MRSKIDEVLKTSAKIKDRVAEQQKIQSKRRLKRKAEAINDGFERDEEINEEEVDKVKILLRQCIDELNKGVEERNKNHPTTGAILFTMKQVKEIASLRSIFKRVSFSNEQMKDFCWFVAKDWYSISEKYFKWVDGGKRELTIATISNQLDLLVGLYNDHSTNPASADPYRLSPSKRPKTMNVDVVTHGNPLNNEQKKMYVDMMMLNISAYDQHCSTLKKLDVEQQQSLQKAFREYVMNYNKVKRAGCVVKVQKQPKSFQSWAKEKYKQ